ncbi:MAG: heme exporter protein CcmB [candidate division Zixibacteria bacterium]|nr:heme exporter protein CcmB [candidate division Zixibacteria bacterium]
MALFKAAYTIFLKDMTVEYRTRERLTTMLIFSVIVLIVFNFAFNFGGMAVQRIAPGMMWTAFVFSGMLGVNRSFAPEKDRGTLDGLLLAPVDRSAIYLGKLFGNLLLIGLIEVITLPLFALFLNLPLLPYVDRLTVVLGLGAIGFAAIGTLFAAVSANSGMREVMLPILLLPVVSPVLIAGVETTTIVFRDGTWEEMSRWLRLLGAFTVVFVVASVVLFDHIVEE